MRIDVNVIFEASLRGGYPIYSPGCTDTPCVIYRRIATHIMNDFNIDQLPIDFVFTGNIRKTVVNAFISDTRLECYWHTI